MDLGGSAIACLSTVDDGSSVDAAEVGIEGVVTGSEDDICCVGSAEEATVEGGGGTGRE